MKNKDLADKVIEKINENHIWINAFTLVNPTPKTLQDIGAMVIGMLKEKERLLPAWHGETKGDVHELAELTPMLYLSINQS